MTVKRFIRKTPTGSLGKYFKLVARDLFASVDWTADDAKIRQSLIKAVDDLDPKESAQLWHDAERVNAMSDEAGEAALSSVVRDRSLLASQENGHDRALWLLLEEPEQFRRAEEALFADERRRRRAWDGFVAVPGLGLRRDQHALEAFKAALAERFATANIHVDLFERSRLTFGGDDLDLVQLSIYREGLPDRLLEFQDRVLNDRAHRPVFEAAMTYEQKTGVIEVVSNDREVREDMVRIMARELLGHELSGAKVPLKTYDLSPLLRRCDFPTDACDGIAAVEVKHLRLMPIDDATERVTLECLGKSNRDIWDMAVQRFGANNPLRNGWVATQARLSIRFHPKDGSRRGRKLPLAISMPNGCNLKEQTHAEQLIGEKYLRRWHILREL